jgi:CitB family two-component system sensor histidine kinase MalK
VIGEGRMAKTKIKLRLQTTITLLVCGVSIVCLLVTNYFIKHNVEQMTIDHIREKARDVSEAAAISPVFINGLSKNYEANQKVIQQYAEKMRKVTNVDFMVVLDMHGIRKSHPNADKIGEKYAGGDAGMVFKGHEHTSIAKGTLGMSLRYFTPVYDNDGKQIGAILVGVLLNEVDRKVEQSTSIIYISLLFGIIIGLIGAILLAKKVKKIMFGMEPDEIANLLEQRSAMLEHAREGVLAVDSDSKITLTNQEAARLFNKIGITHNPIGRKVEDLIPKFHISEVMKTGSKAVDQEYFLNGLNIVANIVPIWVNQEIVGAVATFRDKTEIKQMAEQLTGVRSYAEALRAQTHEFMNKLHVILGMVQMEVYDELLDFVKGISYKFQTEVGFITARFKDPVVAGFILGKVSFARENGASLSFSDECYLPKSKNQDVVQDIVTILGNLIDNSLDAVKGCKEKAIEVEIIPFCHDKLSITVSDTGKGMSQSIINSAFKKGFSTKGEDRGFGLYLVEQSVKKLNGTIKIFSNEGSGTRFNVIISDE